MSIKFKVLLLLVIFLNSFSYVDAQNSRKGKHNTKVTSIQHKSGKVKGTTGRTFEGTLVYVSYEYHSTATQKYSGGKAYNGHRSTTFTVSGNKLHIVDETLCLHTILDGDQNMCYYYSDLTNEGVSYPLNYYTDAYCQLADDSKFNILTWAKNGNTTYKGDNLITRHAKISGRNGTDVQGDVEYWYSTAFRVGKIMNEAMAGLSWPGIIKRYIYDIKVEAPVVGTIRSTVSMELAAMREYHVSPEEFVVPANIKMKPEKIAYNLLTMKYTLKLDKSHVKAVDKLGLLQKEDGGQVLYNMVLRDLV